MGNELNLDEAYAALADAACAVIERWDSPAWKDLPHTGESINALRRALAGVESASVAAQGHARQQDGEESHCTWSLPTLPDALAGIWHSSCGATWSFVEGGPEQNGVRYCQGCGKPVDVQPVHGGQEAKSGE